MTNISFCPYCGNDGVDAENEAILAGPGGAVRVPGKRIECSDCQTTVQVKL